jgi:hypothetical protein
MRLRTGESSAPASRGRGTRRMGRESRVAVGPAPADGSPTGGSPSVID